MVSGRVDGGAVSVGAEVGGAAVVVSAGVVVDVAAGALVVDTPLTGVTSSEASLSSPPHQALQRAT